MAKPGAPYADASVLLRTCTLADDGPPATFETCKPPEPTTWAAPGVRLTG
jgi:hypothetical protein